MYAAPLFIIKKIDLSCEDNLRKINLMFDGTTQGFYIGQTFNFNITNNNNSNNIVYANNLTVSNTSTKIEIPSNVSLINGASYHINVFNAQGEVFNYTRGAINDFIYQTPNCNLITINNGEVTGSITDCSSACRDYNIPTKLGFLDASRVGQQVIPNPSTTGTDIQHIDLPLNQFVLNTGVRGINGEFGIQFAFRPKMELKNVLENHLRYINSLYPCVNRLVLQLRISDVTGTFGTPNNSFIAPLKYVNIDIVNGSIVYPSSNPWLQANYSAFIFSNYFIAPRNESNDISNSVNVLSQLNRSYKLTMSIYLQERENKTCDFKCGGLQFNYRYPVIVMKRSNMNTGFMEIKDLIGNTVKTIEFNNIDAKSIK